jgi:hypothetical protein
MTYVDEAIEIACQRWPWQKEIFQALRHRTSAAAWLLCFNDLDRAHHDLLVAQERLRAALAVVFPCAPVYSRAIMPIYAVRRQAGLRMVWGADKLRDAFSSVDDATDRLDVLRRGRADTWFTQSAVAFTWSGWPVLALQEMPDDAP